MDFSHKGRKEHPDPRVSSLLCFFSRFQSRNLDPEAAAAVRRKERVSKRPSGGAEKIVSPAVPWVTEKAVAVAREETEPALHISQSRVAEGAMPAGAATATADMPLHLRRAKVEEENTAASAGATATEIVVQRFRAGLGTMAAAARGKTTVELAPHPRRARAAEGTKAAVVRMIMAGSAFPLPNQLKPRSISDSKLSYTTIPGISAIYPRRPSCG